MTSFPSRRREARRARSWARGRAAPAALLLVGALASIGCRDYGDLGPPPPISEDHPIQYELAPEGSPETQKVTVQLDTMHCNMGVADPSVDGDLMTLSPAAKGGPVSGGFYVAWSVCNPGRTELTSATVYQLLARRDGAPPAPLLLLDVPPLRPCQCAPELVFVNVPAGSEPQVSRRWPTERLNLGPGRYELSLSNPFETVESDPVELP
jgi:hypothetical protein